MVTLQSPWVHPSCPSGWASPVPLAGKPTTDHQIGHKVQTGRRSCRRQSTASVRTSNGDRSRVVVAGNRDSVVQTPENKQPAVVQRRIEGGHDPPDDVVQTDQLVDAEEVASWSEPVIAPLENRFAADKAVVVRPDREHVHAWVARPDLNTRQPLGHRVDAKGGEHLLNGRDGTTRVRAQGDHWHDSPSDRSRAG